MPSVICRAILFLSGYAPLFLIFSIEFYSRYHWWALIPLAIGVAALIWLLLFLRWVWNGAVRPITVRSVERKDAEVIAYIFAYVFPFLGLKPDDMANAIGLGIFFFVLMVLNVSSNMVHINPALNLLGYHVYQITDGEDLAHTIVTRRNRMNPGTSLNVVIIGDVLSMEK
jgi:hypothetical protein